MNETEIEGDGLPCVGSSEARPLASNDPEDNRHAPPFRRGGAVTGRVDELHGQVLSKLRADRPLTLSERAWARGKLDDLRAIARDAEQLQAEIEKLHGKTVFTVIAEKVDAEIKLLRAEATVARLQAELADAREARNEWMTPFDGCGIEWHEGLPNPYTYQASDFSKLVAAVHEYEAAVMSLRSKVDGQ